MFEKEDKSGTIKKLIHIIWIMQKLNSQTKPEASSEEKSQLSSYWLTKEEIEALHKDAQETLAQMEEYMNRDK